MAKVCTSNADTFKEKNLKVSVSIIWFILKKNKCTSISIKKKNNSTRFNQVEKTLKELEVSLSKSIIKRCLHEWKEVL